MVELVVETWKSVAVQYRCPFFTRHIYFWRTASFLDAWFYVSFNVCCTLGRIDEATIGSIEEKMMKEWLQCCQMFSARPRRSMTKDGSVTRLERVLASTNPLHPKESGVGPARSGAAVRGSVHMQANSCSREGEDARCDYLQKQFIYLRSGWTPKLDAYSNLLRNSG